MVKTFIQRNPMSAAAAFGHLPRASVIHQDVAHRLRRNAKKMGAILPVFLLLPDQSQISLVDQRRRLQRVSHGLLMDIAPRHPAQFCVNHRRPLVERLAVTPAPAL
jgi:hypothetical protein